jgi:hypothetical protein
MLMFNPAVRTVRRADLAGLPVPRRTRSHRPIPHHDAADALIEAAEDRGLKVRSERWSVADGAMYPEAGSRLHVPAARLFGTIDFEPIPGIDLPDGVTPSAGLRNSHDKSFALSVLSGGRVFVCSNGVLAGEHIISRKHTSGIDLGEAIDRALDAFMNSVRGLGEMIERLRAQRLSRQRSHSLIVEAARAGAFSSAMIIPVLNAYENPEHREFRPRTAWSLMNAGTEVMKRQSPARQVEGLKALTDVLVDHREAVAA